MGCKDIIVLFLGLLLLHSTRGEGDEDLGGSGGGRYKIEGRVVRPDSSSVGPADWFATTKVFINTGNYGFLREDGSFVINNVPTGSYVVQVMNPTFMFEPVRVDINSKGKMRARVLNNIQTSQVTPVAYPLRLEASGPYTYFVQREQWRLTDFLMNPMVLVTVLPLLLMMVLPRFNDPETRKEMEQLQMPKMDTPELSEIMTSLFAGGSQQQSKKAKTGKKKDGGNYRN